MSQVHKAISFLNERGASAVEFALVLPVLMLILFGTIEFGMVMYSREVLTNASREGARAGIVQQIPKPSAGAIQNVVTNYLAGTGITMANVTLPIGVAGAGGVFPNDLTVTVQYRYDFFVPAILGLGTSINLSAQTVMRHE
jgi:Flp pilus assembly protein TadG